MPEKRISFEIKEHLGIINTSSSGWKKELNLVAWNGNEAKYDIREWDEHHERMGKGITLSQWEMQKVTDLYLKNNNDKAIARGRAIEDERRARMELQRKQFAEEHQLKEEGDDADDICPPTELSDTDAFDDGMPAENMPF